MAYLLRLNYQLFKYFLFWLIIFLVAKIVFLIWCFGLSSQLSITEISGIFLHGFKMDVSTACYLLLLPGLFMLFQPVLPLKYLNRLFWFYTLVVLTVASFLMVLDLALYPYWGTRVSIIAFSYANDPVALEASVSIPDLLLGLLTCGMLITGFLFLYKRLFRSVSAIDQKFRWYYLPVQLVVVAALIIPIRGGFDTSPLNLSSVAFSQKMFVNQSASNYLWNFINSVVKRKKFINPCTYMSKEESETIFRNFIDSDTASRVPNLIRLENDRPPNVLLVILESFSNKVIAPLGGLSGIAPCLDSLCESSTLFTSFYASGNRSDRGISAILGGYPSLLTTSIMMHPEKSARLKMLQDYFNSRNYSTSFYYGGDINFYNLKTLVLQGKCTRIVSKTDFPAGLGRMTKWGVPDGYVFEKALQDLNTEKSPFMMIIYTISSHPPYDVPFSRIKGKSFDDMFLNSVAYTDSCLGVFIHSFRKSSLWGNTLLIVTSDHGAIQPAPADITHPATYRIPLLWTGGVVDSVQRIETITQQTDFMPSLISQLGWSTDSTKFSGSFFKAFPFAFYMLDTGWGYVVPEGNFYFDQGIGEFVSKSESKSVDLVFPKAYMQVLHDDFLNK